MAGGFFSRLFGKGGTEHGSGKVSRGGALGQKGPWAKPASDVVEALIQLDDWKSGLASRAAAYIETGSDRPVLSEIETLRSTPRQAGGHHSHAYRRTQRASMLQLVLMASCGGQPERLARYAEVLRAMEGQIRLTYNFHSNTRLDAPDPVASLLMRLSQQRHGLSRTEMAAKIGAPTQLEDLQGAVQILGGRPADLLIFDLGRTYGERLYLEQTKSVGDAVLNAAPVEEIIHAFRAMEGGTRARALQTAMRVKRMKDPALVGFLMEELGAGSAKVREQARLILMTHEASAVEPLAIKALSAGKAALRGEAAVLLGEIGTDTAKAALAERREKEKTSSVIAIIDQYVSANAATTEAAEPVAEGTYLAADGTVVEIPEFVPLPEDNSPALDDEDRKALAEARQAQDRKALEWYKDSLARAKERGWDVSKRKKPIPIDKKEDAIFDWISTGIASKDGKLRADGLGDRRLNHGYVGTWLLSRIDKLPLKRQVQVVTYSAHNFTYLFSRWHTPPLVEKITDLMDEGAIDLRHMIQEGRAMNMKLSSGTYRNQSFVPLSSGAFAEAVLAGGVGLNLPDDAVWPLFADYLNEVIDALPPRTTNAVPNARALQILGLFPKLPAAAVQPVLFCAISERRNLREAAQALLTEVEGIDARLIEVLGDKRQAVRGNAARFLADRETAEAVPHIVKRLKKEKSESAKAEMISALARLGADTSAYLGQKALVAEAEALVAKLPDAKMNWLPRDQAPPLRWNNGKAAPAVLTDAWLRLALKLKDPAGSPLFGLYLDQMQAEDVTGFADWLLSAWIAYDTDRGDVSALREKARESAEQAKANPNWTFYQNTPIDQLTEMFLRPMLSSYPNSGTDAKGLLALTHRGTPSVMTPRIQSYLKNHGKRVSQAKSLVEVLAATGTPEALQVLVATATRFKQRTVRELAEKLVGEIAAERGWSEDELADRSVPSGGFEEDGTLELEVGEESKLYLARLGEDLTVKIYNPDGKVVKNLPAGKDANTKESKSLLSAAKKAVKTVTTQQADRLYGAMVAERLWPLSDWQADIIGHPILRRLAERVIWLGYNEAKELVASFRPTPEGDLLAADGDDADLAKVAFVAVAHTSHLAEDVRQEWLTHLGDFEVEPLFAQIARPMQVLTAAQRAETGLVDRKGWLMESLKLRSVTTKAGFDRGPVEDGAGFNTYIKPFRSAGITAVLEFTGSYVPEDNIPAAIIEMRFTRGDGAYGKVLKLGDVPPILLSEVWADLYQIAEAGAFDEDWQKKGLY